LKGSFPSQGMSAEENDWNGQNSFDSKFDYYQLALRRLLFYSEISCSGVKSKGQN
jgi:hypothetical protein